MTPTLAGLADRSLRERLRGCAAIKKQSGGIPIEKIPITADIMRIDTRTQAVDMRQIDTRRFMFDPTHETFGGTWLSDFVSNRLGGFIGEPAPEPEKPDCALIGQDGNIFNLVGIAARTLREHDRKDRQRK